VSVHVGPFDVTCYILSFCLGEVLEKATRVMTDEDKALLDEDFVGKNGQRRKLEVSVVSYSYHICDLNILHVAYHGSSKTEKVLPI
jgi:hypothetical protein